ncbi:MAG: excinuclease ABC subunit A, partial [Aeromicrobium sp.]
IDLGPEGGKRGGLVIAEGTPEDVAAREQSFTGQFLAPILEKGRSGMRSARPSIATGSRRRTSTTAAAAPVSKTATATPAAAKKTTAKKTTAKKTATKATATKSTATKTPTETA